MPHLRVDDIRLYYETTGQGPSLLLLHGLGSSTRDWQRQVDFFAAHYQVVTVDMRGHGQSDKPPGPYSIPLFACDTAALIEALDLAPAHVVGISMGGMVAFQLALDRPELVQTMTIVNSEPEAIPDTLMDKIRLLQRRLIIRLFGTRTIGKVLTRRLFPYPEQQNLRTLFTERWAENDKQTYLDALDAIVGWRVTDRLPEIHCPTLVIAAEDDYTPVDSKKAYVQKIPQAELVVIPDARHALPVERPDRFNETLQAFLSRHD